MARQWTLEEQEQLSLKCCCLIPKSSAYTSVLSIFKWTLNFILNVLTTFKVLMLFKHEVIFKYEPWPKWEGTQ